MPASPEPAKVVRVLSEHPHVSALAKKVRAAAMSAAEAGRTSLTPDEAATNGVTSEQAETQFGNALLVLKNGPSRPEERMLLGALLALAVRETPPQDDDAWETLASRLCWLATHTTCDALSAADAALPDPEPLWRAIADLVLSPVDADQGLGTPERMIAALALRESSSRAAHDLADRLEGEVSDPALQRVLQAPATHAVSASSETTSRPLVGELTWTPRGPIATALLAVSGILFARSVIRLALRYAFAWRRPATVSFSHRGVEINHRTELLGRVLRTRHVVVPVANLSNVTRETRYSRVGFYAGLTSLVVGTYFGVGLFIDGLRAPGGSPSLIALGLAFVALGLVLDFVLSTFLDSSKNTVRMVVVAKDGLRLCIGALAEGETDTLLRALAQQSGLQGEPKRAAEAKPAVAKSKPPEEKTVVAESERANGSQGVDGDSPSESTSKGVTES